MNMDDVINMDVQRSFTKMKCLDPEILNSILKTYAFFNPEVEYCQGMNFIAGFLYLVFQDEETTFKALHEIIEKYEMTELLNQSLFKLKLFFYQFDRLVNIFLHGLHSHFKNEMINSSFYSSSWFITIFTNSLQNQEGENISENLMQLWDNFLISGWKAIFYMGLFILQENQDILIQMDFEHIVNYLIEQPKQFLAQNQINLDETQGQYSHLHVALKQKLIQSDRLKYLSMMYLLNKLEKEFSDSLNMANKQESSIKQN